MHLSRPTSMLPAMNLVDRAQAAAVSGPSGSVPAIIYR